jgi:transposase
MVKGIATTPEKYKQIVHLHEEGKACREISRLTKISVATVSRCVGRYLRNQKLPKSGAPPKLSPRDQRKVKRAVKKQKSISLRKLTGVSTTHVSHQTIGRFLRSAHIRKRKMKRRPKLSATHCAERVRITKQHITDKVDFSKVIFSDEKKFRFDGPDGWRYYWSEIGKDEAKDYYSKDYGKFKGVMVWMAISKAGLVHIERLDGNIDSELYSDMILSKAVPDFHYYHGTDFVFQQDNSRIHTSKFTLKCFEDYEIPLFPHPPLSPDLNPVENVWALLVRRLYAEGKGYTSEQSLWEAIQAEAEKITPADIAPFIDSMIERCVAVIENKGKYIQ